MDRTAKIYVAGPRGMVGSAIVRAFRAAGHTAIVTRSSSELDLRDGAATRAFLMARASCLWCFAHAPVILDGIILPRSVRDFWNLW